MKVKSVVKVMNFHALVRVDKARREAEKYFIMEQKLRSMIDAVTNNLNLMLDKYVLSINKNKPALNIYIGSDMGFCGGYNYNVNESAIRDDDAEKIMIGKKFRTNIPNVIMRLNKADYMEHPELLEDFISKGILRGQFSEINIIYNEYINSSTIKWNIKRVFPFEFEDSDTVYTEDIVCETDINELIKKMVVTYICYEIMITAINSNASENIMRQNSTSESLKKIDEIEEAEKIAERKEISTKSFQKLIETYTKMSNTDKN